MSARRSVAAAMAVICIDAPRLRSCAYNYLARRLFAFHNLNTIRVSRDTDIVEKILFIARRKE